MEFEELTVHATDSVEHYWRRVFSVTGVQAMVAHYRKLKSFRPETMVVEFARRNDEAPVVRKVVFRGPFLSAEGYGQRVYNAADLEDLPVNVQEKIGVIIGKIAGATPRESIFTKMARRANGWTTEPFTPRRKGSGRWFGTSWSRKDEQAQRAPPAAPLGRAQACEGEPAPGVPRPPGYSGAGASRSRPTAAAALHRGRNGRLQVHGSDVRRIGRRRDDDHSSAPRISGTRSAHRRARTDRGGKMLTKIIEVTNGENNWGKFLIGAMDGEYGRRSTVDPDDTRSLLQICQWRPRSILVLDLQTGEGARFTPPGFAAADLNQQHQIWVCPLYEPFLTWLYEQDLTNLDALPDHIDLPNVPGGLYGYRRSRPKGSAPE